MFYKSKSTMVEPIALLVFVSHRTHEPIKKYEPMENWKISFMSLKFDQVGQYTRSEKKSKFNLDHL